ncbi:MAG: thioredoxin family protein [Pseudomonadota bacterium]
MTEALPGEPMKRQKRKSNASRKSAATPPVAAKKKKMSRREALGLAKFLGVGAAVLGGGGWYFTTRVMAGISEGNLSKIGDGMPAIVQVHDPQCPDCRALQRAARQAMEQMEGAEFHYLVASLDTPQGRQLAQDNGVGRVTLLLYDGNGRVRSVIRGRRSADALVEAFDRHLRRYPPTPGASG